MFNLIHLIDIRVLFNYFTLDCCKSNYKKSKLNLPVAVKKINKSKTLGLIICKL